MKLYEEDFHFSSDEIDVHADMSDDGPTGATSYRIHVFGKNNQYIISVDKLVNKVHETFCKEWKVCHAVANRFVLILERTEKESDMLWKHDSVEQLIAIVEAAVALAAVTVTHDGLI